MLIYHGTTERVARLALTEGLRPREDTGTKGNWEHTSPSHPGLVYLTTAYAAYFALSAVGEGERMGIVEIDLERLDVARLRPDEDYLEEVRDHHDEMAQVCSGCPTSGGRFEVTAWLRDNIDRFAGIWKESAARLGNCAYAGTVPPEAITRISVVAPSVVMGACGVALDPAIRVGNYQVCGGLYRALTRWFMGESVPLSDLVDSCVLDRLPQDKRVDVDCRYGQEQSRLEVTARLDADPASTAV